MIQTETVLDVSSDNQVLNALALVMQVFMLAIMALINRKQNKTHKTAEAVAETTNIVSNQVVNGHAKPFRDDFDIKHKETLNAIRLVDDRTLRQIEATHNRLNSHVDRFNHLDKRFDNLETLIIGLSKKVDNGNGN